MNPISSLHPTRRCSIQNPTVIFPHPFLQFSTQPVTTVDRIYYKNLFNLPLFSVIIATVLVDVCSLKQEFVSWLFLLPFLCAGTRRIFAKRHPYHAPVWYLVGVIPNCLGDKTPSFLVWFWSPWCNLPPVSGFLYSYPPLTIFTCCSSWKRHFLAFSFPSLILPYPSRLTVVFWGASYSLLRWFPSFSRVPMPSWASHAHHTLDLMLQLCS